MCVYVYNCILVYVSISMHTCVSVCEPMYNCVSVCVYVDTYEYVWLGV